MEIIGNTTVYNIADPAGFDLEIGHMQGVLSKLTFLDTLYARAHIQEQARSKQEIDHIKVSQPNIKGRDLYTRRYPQGRKLDQDIDLTFSDIYKSMGFFYAADPVIISKKDWTVYEGQVFAQQPFSFMFWTDLRKLNCPSGEYLKIAIIKQLNTMNNLKVGNMYESFDTVLKDFTITDNLMMLCRYPYYALRVEAVSTYPLFREGCGCINTFDENSLINLNRTSITTPGQVNIN